jgi:hypothetical protein
MAVDLFHTQMESMNMAVEETVPKLGVKSSSEAFVWAQLHPDKWVEVIRDGDEVRVEGGRASSNSHVSGTIVTFYLPCAPASRCCRITMPLPSTYEVSSVYMRKGTFWPNSPTRVKHAEAIVRQEFHSVNFPHHGVALMGTKKDIGGKYLRTRILPTQWLPTIIHMIKENPAFEIEVDRISAY